MVPNDMFKFRISVDFDVYLQVFVKSGEHSADDVQEKYFTQEAIDALKEQFIEHINDNPNPFSIYCVDEDSDYDIDDDQLFDMED